MAASVPMTAPRSRSIPGARTSIDVRAAARRGAASVTTGAGRAISTSGLPSARCTWRHSRDWVRRRIVPLRRACDQLDDTTARGVNQVVEEAATVIGEYDEGFSNRQTWNNAALAAAAVWFEDEELAQRVVEGETGLIAHLERGYGRDGMWYEGENYHLFALRGLLTGAGWARLAGVDFREDQRLADRVHAALLAPSLTALPDFTYPARKDSRFGVSLAQPGYLEVWEVGLARLGTTDIGAWLEALYKVPPPTPELQESYLHEAGAQRPAHGGRCA